MFPDVFVLYVDRLDKVGTMMIKALARPKLWRHHYLPAISMLLQDVCIKA